MGKKSSRQKSARSKKAEEPNLRVNFNGITYSNEQWKAYLETGEPSKIIWDYFQSDRCPPERKAAWDELWRILLAEIMYEPEEGQKEVTLSDEQVLNKEVHKE